MSRWWKSRSSYSCLARDHIASKTPLVLCACLFFLRTPACSYLERKKTNKQTNQAWARNHLLTLVLVLFQKENTCRLLRLQDKESAATSLACTLHLLQQFHQLDQATLQCSWCHCNQEALCEVDSLFSHGSRVDWRRRQGQSGSFESQECRSLAGSCHRLKGW